MGTLYIADLGLTSTGHFQGPSSPVMNCKHLEAINENGKPFLQIEASCSLNHHHLSIAASHIYAAPGDLKQSEVDVLELNPAYDSTCRLT